jgi:hypothetical protein
MIGENSAASATQPSDLELVRAMLARTPAERLRTAAAYWPLVRVGLMRRAAAGGTVRP